MRYLTTYIKQKFDLKIQGQGQLCDFTRTSHQIEDVEFIRDSHGQTFLSTLYNASPRERVPESKRTEAKRTSSAWLTRVRLYKSRRVSENSSLYSSDKLLFRSLYTIVTAKRGAILGIRCVPRKRWQCTRGVSRATAAEISNSLHCCETARRPYFTAHRP